jgi:mono/diheme cytochrome c family protein
MTILKSVFLIVCCISLLSFVASCGKKSENETIKTGDGKGKTETKDSSKETSASTQSSPGKDFFYAKSKENNIACADCHGDGSNLKNSLTKYFSNVQGADKRKSVFHGKFSGADVSANASGATVCWESYMKMKTPMTPEQIANLNKYYSSLPNPNPVDEVKYETISLPQNDKAKLKEAQKKIMALTGDAVNGEKKFEEACGLCHGANKTVKKVPDLFDEFEGNIKSITYNVRFGDGAMPFFNEGVLSNQDVADISAYILKKNGK